MVPNWLYGPQRSTPDGGPGTYSPAVHVQLRNLTLDVEALRDLADRLTVAKLGFPDPAAREEPVVEYIVNQNWVDPGKLNDLDLTDLNQLQFNYILAVPNQAAPNPPLVRVTLFADTATLEVVSNGNVLPNLVHILAESAIEYLNQLGTPRPWWRGLRATLPIIPATIAVAAWIASLFLALPLAVYLLTGALVTLATAGALVWARQLSAHDKQHPQRSIRFRSESRARTKQRRADGHANLKNFLLTAPISAALGVAGTLLVQALAR